VTVYLVLPGVLKDDAGGLDEVAVETTGATSLSALLDDLGARFPLLERRIRDETGALRRHVNVFVGEDDVRALDGTATVVDDGERVLVLPAVSGG
jgi:molybdopterin synthase sulfur carrier subunit